MNDLFNSLPKTIRLGAFDIDVICKEGVEVGGRLAHGCWRGSDQVIELDTKNISNRHLLCVLLHELNHALFWYFEIIPSAKEEQIVSCLSTGWTEIYRNNPKLVEWIKKASQ